jgi:hypothetical protein
MLDSAEPILPDANRGRDRDGGSMPASPDSRFPAATAMLSGVSLLAARYEGFILDQWGVLHDGVTPYPGALDCVRRLHEAGKRWEGFAAQLPAVPRYLLPALVW